MEVAELKYLLPLVRFLPRFKCVDHLLGVVPLSWEFRRGVQHIFPRVLTGPSVQGILGTNTTVQNLEECSCFCERERGKRRGKARDTNVMQTCLEEVAAFVLFFAGVIPGTDKGPPKGAIQEAVRNSWHPFFHCILVEL